jgi:hypothetical protein
MPPLVAWHRALMQTGRHAHYAGWVIGLAQGHGLPVEPEVDEDGNHTDRFSLTLGGHTITLVVPSPPDDWEPPATDG